MGWWSDSTVDFKQEDYLKAIERVRAKRRSLNLTTAQMQQLKDREDTEKAAFESAIRNLYQSVLSRRRPPSG